MQNVPAISLLVTFIIIFSVLAWKLSASQLEKIFAGKNFLLLASLLLFMVLLVVHLFQNQPWTADILKVIVGVLVGAGAALFKEEEKDKKEKSTGQGSNVDVNASQFGDNAKIAGRDINEVIEKMEGDINNMKGNIDQISNAVINQYQTLGDSLAELSSTINNSPLVIRRAFRLESRTEDKYLQTKLMDIQRQKNDWFTSYIDEYLSSDEFRWQVSEKINELQEAGWAIRSVRPVDNLNNGLLVELEAERLLQ